MKIGLIDVDGHNFPNLSLMKISSFHKSMGDDVEWWSPIRFYDMVYKSKVFSFTPDIPDPINTSVTIGGVPDTQSNLSMVLKSMILNWMNLFMRILSDKNQTIQSIHSTTLRFR